jgi:hypothetical protein
MGPNQEWRGCILRSKNFQITGFPLRTTFSGLKSKLHINCLFSQLSTPTPSILSSNPMETQSDPEPSGETALDLVSKDPRSSHLPLL